MAQTLRWVITWGCFSSQPADQQLTARCATDGELRGPWSLLRHQKKFPQDQGFYSCHITKLGFCLFVCFLRFTYLCMSAVFGCMPAGQKRASDTSTDGCEYRCGYWKLNSGPQEEQSVLLTAEPSLWPPLYFYFWDRFSSFNPSWSGTQHVQGHPLLSI